MAEDNQPNLFGHLEELMKLQSGFQQRLAEETLNYLRQLQGMVGPITPGTLVKADSPDNLAITTSPGKQAPLTLETTNRQRVHALVTPLFGTLVNEQGLTWFPEAAINPPQQLLGPTETSSFEISISIPTEIDAGVYRGVCLLYGYENGALPVQVTIKKKVTRKKAAEKPAAKTAKKTIRSTTKSKAKSAKTTPRKAKPKRKDQ